MPKRRQTKQKSRKMRRKRMTLPICRLTPTKISMIFERTRAFGDGKAFYSEQMIHETYRIEQSARSNSSL